MICAIAVATHPVGYATPVASPPGQKLEKGAPCPQAICPNKGETAADSPEERKLSTSFN